MIRAWVPEGQVVLETRQARDAASGERLQQRRDRVPARVEARRRDEQQWDGEGG